MYSQPAADSTTQMKTQIPEELKKDVPQTTWGRMLLATPVVMTVVATLLAGLASSEMTRAQYDRALAAQLQSKAGDQWSYFQAKKLRSSLQHNSIDLLQATADLRPLDPAVLASADAATRAALLNGEAPVLALPAFDARLKSALEAVEASRPETEISELLKSVEANTLADALTAAKESALAFDVLTKPVNQAIEKLEKSVATDKALLRDCTAARMRYTAARYDAEARLNQVVANLYELQVRKSNLSAERHHKRSGKFFFGMLCAQAAVIVSTFAMAARQRNLLWTLAAAAGVAAIIFAVYVYLRI